MPKAISQGDWALVQEEALRWSQSDEPSPRAFFALNAMHLLQGEFREAWQMHAKSLQEREDIETVREWVDEIQARYPEVGAALLFVGLFLAQSGESEKSVSCYEKAAEFDVDIGLSSLFPCTIISANGPF